MNVGTRIAPRFTFCGDRDPHRQHEYLDGMRRMECPGVRYTPTLEEVTDRIVAEHHETLRKLAEDD